MPNVGWKHEYGRSNVLSGLQKTQITRQNHIWRFWLSLLTMPIHSVANDMYPHVCDWINEQLNAKQEINAV